MRKSLSKISRRVVTIARGLNNIRQTIVDNRRFNALEKKFFEEQRIEEKEVLERIARKMPIEEHLERSAFRDRWVEQIRECNSLEELDQLWRGVIQPVFKAGKIPKDTQEYLEYYYLRLKNGLRYVEKENKRRDKDENRKNQRAKK